MTQISEKKYYVLYNTEKNKYFYNFSASYEAKFSENISKARKYEITEHNMELKVDLHVLRKILKITSMEIRNLFCVVSSVEESEIVGNLENILNPKTTELDSF